MEAKINEKPIRLTNKKAIRLAKLRALHEGRTATNAATQTILEALSGRDFIKKADAEQDKK